MKTTSIVSLMIIGSSLGLGCNKQQAKAPEPEPTKVAPEPVKAPEPPAPVAFEIDAAKLAAFAPLPAVFGNEAELTKEKVELGKMLFWDKRLSVNGTQSCNSCHTLAMFGVDNLPTSPGAKGKNGERNSPTVMNAAGHFVQFWDGREPDVEAQAKGPILNPVEMGMKDGKAVVATLKKVKAYAAAFQAAFPGEKDAITFDNYAKAVGAFERKLVTPSKWDAYLKGDKAALSEAEKKGAVAFMDAGCTACHAGPLVGGSMYQKLGAVKPWPSDKDKGRGALLKDATQDFFFKVPSLRNIEKTAPYFHDGSVKTLEEAVKLMATHQLGKDLTDEQVQSIVTFLKTLTGQADAALLAEPTIGA